MLGTGVARGKGLRSDVTAHIIRHGLVDGYELMAERPNGSREWLPGPGCRPPAHPSRNNVAVDTKPVRVSCLPEGLPDFGTVPRPPDEPTVGGRLVGD